MEFPDPRYEQPDMSGQQFRMMFQSPTYSSFRPDLKHDPSTAKRDQVLPNSPMTNRKGFADGPAGNNPPMMTKEIQAEKKDHMLVEIQRVLRSKKLADLDAIAKMLRGD